MEKIASRSQRLNTVGIIMLSTLLTGIASAATAAGEPASPRAGSEEVTLSSGVVVPAEPGKRTPSEATRGER